MVFELPLSEGKVKPHQVTALHLLAGLAITGAGAMFYLFYPASKLWSLPLLIAGIGLLLVVMFRNKWLTKPATNRIVRIAELMVMLCLASYSAIHSWTPPAVMFGILSATILFALFWEQSSSNSLTVKIDNSGIKLPLTSRKRFIAWQEVEHVILKFGTLTINCYDNRLFQWTIAATVIDKEAFESFCNTRIQEAKKTVVNDW